ncbi:type VI secretion system tip protein VgrG [Myxococcus sp. K15C18031901]|uniref:type VI secretion system tip protein VgrG n=1 Tax=Myxococcus dinghuensis TaxID=2906761 RepID=UPI0020A7015F|nr:type VI secretion system tip protein VgrG [Myxococcus dinghuensis]MCP3100285.1 type VI secretion system tip protein VgrG [Myxococcus dinghuensis]
MSTPSPLTNEGARSTFVITSNGTRIPATYQVISVDTWLSVNKLPRARLVLFDGEAATGTFPISATDTFLPGAEVSIAAGYDGKNTVIFEGVVCRQGLEIDTASGSRLVVELTDAALKMTLERKSGFFEKVKDSALIEKLLSRNGLSGTVDATSVVHPEVVQYYATDWDLMVTRAQLNGLLVMADGGAVVVTKPDTTKAPVLAVKYGESILDLQTELDATTQYDASAIKGISWDAATQKLLESGPGAVSVKEQGNVTSARLSQVFGAKKVALQTGAELQPGDLQAWASAELLKSKLSKIRGTVRFHGSALARVGAMLELGGLGPRFNGAAFMSGVHHHIEDGVWLTSVDFGLSARWYTADTQDIAAPDASGQLPPIKGLQTGIVKQVARDPEGELRVLVGLPLLQEPSQGVWARLGTFYASSGVGALFYPEVDDEVVVGFMNEDPRFPVILGAVYGKQHATPSPPDEKNTRKAVVTRSKLELSFDDEKKVVSIKTPGGHLLELDDTSGAITLKDSTGNSLVLGKSGVTLDSASNLKVSAKGNVSVAAGGNLSLEATGNVTVKGVQVAHTASMKFSASGSAQAELTSSGMLTVRGSMVKIN